MLAGTDAAGADIKADVTVHGPNWVGGNFAVTSNRDDETYAGFGVYQPNSLADGSGCSNDEQEFTVGKTPRALARQLARPRGARSSSHPPRPMRSVTTHSTCG